MKRILTGKDLPRLNEIQEKLGVELDILFKAYENNKFYAKNPYGFDKDVKIVECFDVELELAMFDKNRFQICGSFSLPSEKFNHCYWYASDYGKTWALTKEELE